MDSVSIAIQNRFKLIEECRQKKVKSDYVYLVSVLENAIAKCKINMDAIRADLLQKIHDIDIESSSTYDKSFQSYISIDISELFKNELRSEHCPMYIMMNDTLYSEYFMISRVTKGFPVEFDNYLQTLPPIYSLLDLLYKEFPEAHVEFKSHINNDFQVLLITIDYKVDCPFTEPLKFR
jgi:hypothetical protein